MAKFSYEIKTPKGTFQVDSEKELTDAQAYAFATTGGGQVAAPPPPPTQRAPSSPAWDEVEKYSPAAGMSGLDKFVTGAGAATARAIEGVKGLVGADTTEEAEDRQLYQQHHPGGWATAGEVAGDVAMSALPIGAVNKVAQTARVTRALPQAVARYAPLAADVAANAGYAAATAPDNRGDAALFGGAGAAGGRVLTRALGGAVRPSKAAQELMNQGVKLSPGQAGEGAMGALASGYERGLGAIPIVGAPVNAMRRGALDDWQQVLANKIRPQGNETANVAGLKDAYRQAYREALPPGQLIKPSEEALAGFRTTASDLASDLPPSARAKFEELTAWIDNRLENGIKAEHWKDEIGGEISGAIRSAKREGQNSLVRALNKLDSHLDSLPPGRSIGELDKGYRSFQVLKKAGDKAAAIKRSGAITPEELLQTASKAGDERLVEAARTAQPILQGANGPQGLEKLIGLAKTGVGAAVGHGVAGPVIYPAAVASLMGATPMGRKVLLGQYPWQKFFQENPELAAQVARAWSNANQERR